MTDLAENLSSDQAVVSLCGVSWTLRLSLGQKQERVFDGVKEVQLALSKKWAR